MYFSRYKDIAPVRHLKRFCRLLFDEQHRDTHSRQRRKVLFEQFASQSHRQTCCRLIKYQNGRTEHQYPAHANHLAFAAGKLRHVTLSHRRQRREHLENLFDPTSNFSARKKKAAHLKVLDDCQRTKYVIVLRDITDATTSYSLGGPIRDVLALKMDLAFQTMQMTNYRLNQCTFPGAVRASDNRDRSPVNRK